MNRTWTIRVNIVACVLLAFGLLKLILIGYTYYLIMDLYNQKDPPIYRAEQGIGYLTKSYDTIVSGLISLAGSLLMLMKRRAGWIIATALFTETLVFLGKFIIWPPADISTEDSPLIKVIFWGMILVFLVCLICLASNPVRKEFKIQLKHLLLTGALTALFIADSLFFYA